MSRQSYYTGKWENKNSYPEISLWISGKTGAKTFCCRICHTKPLYFGNMRIKALIKDTWKNIQLYKKVETSENQSSLSKSFEASACNKFLHQETFTVPSYQVKKAEILLAVHIIVTHNTKNNGKIYKVLFPDSKIPEQLELEQNYCFSSMLQGATFLLITYNYWFRTKICVLLQ